VFEVNNPTQLSAGHGAIPARAGRGPAGVGSPPDLLARLLRRETGTQFGLVPYRGAAPAMQDVIAGQIDAMFVSFGPALPHVTSGAVKALGLTARARRGGGPDIPTRAGGVLRGVHFSCWGGPIRARGTARESLRR